MAFFGLQEAHLAGDNDFFGIRMMELRLKSAGVFVMSCVDGFYAAAIKNIYFVKNVVKKFFTYFFNDEGGE